MRRVCRSDKPAESQSIASSSEFGSKFISHAVAERLSRFQAVAEVQQPILQRAMGSVARHPWPMRQPTMSNGRESVAASQAPFIPNDRSASYLYGRAERIAIDRHVCMPQNILVRAESRFPISNQKPQRPIEPGTPTVNASQLSQAGCIATTLKNITRLDATRSFRARARWRAAKSIAVNTNRPFPDFHIRFFVVILLRRPFIHDRLLAKLHSSTWGQMCIASPYPASPGARIR